MGKIIFLDDDIINNYRSDITISSNVLPIAAGCGYNSSLTSSINYVELDFEELNYRIQSMKVLCNLYDAKSSTASYLNNKSNAYFRYIFYSHTNTSYDWVKPSSSKFGATAYGYSDIVIPDDVYKIRLETYAKKTASSDSSTNASIGIKEMVTDKEVIGSYISSKTYKMPEDYRVANMVTIETMTVYTTSSSVTQATYLTRDKIKDSSGTLIDLPADFSKDDAITLPITTASKPTGIIFYLLDDSSSEIPVDISLSTKRSVIAQKDIDFKTRRDVSKSRTDTFASKRIISLTISSIASSKRNVTKTIDLTYKTVRRVYTHKIIRLSSSRLAVVKQLSIVDSYRSTITNAYSGVDISRQVVNSNSKKIYFSRLVCTTAALNCNVHRKVSLRTYIDVDTSRQIVEQNVLKINIDTNRLIAITQFRAIDTSREIINRADLCLYTIRKTSCSYVFKSSMLRLIATNILKSIETHRLIISNGSISIRLRTERRVSKLITNRPLLIRRMSNNTSKLLDIKKVICIDAEEAILTRRRVIADKELIANLLRSINKEHDAIISAKRLIVINKIKHIDMNRYVKASKSIKLRTRRLITAILKRDPKYMIQINVSMELKDGNLEIVRQELN